MLPVDVLGQVYEQFLGSVIHLEDDHRATVEQKAGVRKAGGVYYTPTYIVDYIVENTVGKLLEDKKPGPRGGASRLKIVDPACGSGSFLIGAYEYLLDWPRRDRYLEDGPEKHRDRLHEGSGGQWHLTIDEKKRILLNNIYGVDIDPQAVEVTKLSLLIKVLEGESEQSLQAQLRMFQERALPDLRENIKCGNSLIGPNLYENEQMVLLDEEEHYDAARHEKMVGLVERMLALHERLAEAKIERERTVIGHQISATDKQIDNLVYELYGLTDEEIKIVEEATR